MTVNLCGHEGHAADWTGPMTDHQWGWLVASIQRLDYTAKAAENIARLCFKWADVPETSGAASAFLNWFKTADDRHKKCLHQKYIEACEGQKVIS